MNKQSGFTLVEIMIVVAIIALLAAIAVPNFLRARQRSLATAVKNDIRLIESAADQYAIENGLGGNQSVAWDSITGYFKTGSKLADGRTALTGIRMDTVFATVQVGKKLTAEDFGAIVNSFDIEIVPTTFWDE
ncbi:prepilin-type N-terminal cleavage/methylation domain-containing protein [Kamptonema cortianum]|nr:prepilin-type N-terminal cleavage/methylation domain-containing protein [Oscillatoria laete-virens]MDK3157913.1 prepilin-type N-terminal cleavage/methylation domain-containing protein [Kamptonema cortianum]MDL5046044.1 prepilin-type N-terminal cleavage/methylation domain-containing protein [Oscillatoria amoena NRMC-F 0135]MDL5052751.1 prepilin-type N-terminal cleavage/methylation domain-containing protein [Oscillatoria laete-virens NRMC-F 0139]